MLHPDWLPLQMAKGAVLSTLQKVYQKIILRWHHLYWAFESPHFRSLRFDLCAFDFSKRGKDIVFISGDFGLFYYYYWNWLRNFFLSFIASCMHAPDIHIAVGAAAIVAFDEFAWARGSRSCQASAPCRRKILQALSVALHWCNAKQALVPSPMFTRSSGDPYGWVEFPTDYQFFALKCAHTLLEETISEPNVYPQFFSRYLLRITIVRIKSTLPSKWTDMLC